MNGLRPHTQVCGTVGRFCPTMIYWNVANHTDLDYPAVVIPVDVVRPSDLCDDISNAKYGADDARLYSICMYSGKPRTSLGNLTDADTGPEVYRDAPLCVQLVGYRYADEALMHTASLVDSIINGVK